ncbi:hypothetical protein K438DRAFT_1943317 [Mycena galopus ATCC 62051]|nr:hypothetical protein K438DRAFT_1943317 [Mycena galopus ATCC 62051]
MPMFSGGSGYHIQGGNFYDVSGDVNLHTHQHVMLPDHIRLEWAATYEHGSRFPSLEDDWTEGSGRLLPGVARNPRSAARGASRRVPYDTSSSLRLLGSGPTNRQSSRSTTDLTPSMPDDYDPSPPSPGPDQPPSPAYESGPRITRDSVHPPRAIQGATVINANNVHHNYDPLALALNTFQRTVSQEALYNSADSFPQPRCHPETRIEMLNNLYGWATDNNCAFPICWLYGPAGAGKSAIMQTLCQRLQNAGAICDARLPLAVHNSLGNNDPQAAKNLKNQLRELILRRVVVDPTVVARDMAVQLQELIIEPGRSLKNSVSPIFLIDGLDECAGEEDQRQILRLIGNTDPSAFRFLIASRPEAHIREVLDNASFHRILRSVNIERSFEDVRHYLRDEFARIHHEHKATMVGIPTPWPAKDVVEALVTKSSGHFVYAATVIQFIDDKYFRPTERLAVVQNLEPSSDSPFGILDQLYSQILSRIHSKYHDKLLLILCAANYYDLCVEHIEQILHLEPGDVELVLRVGAMLEALSFPSRPWYQCDSVDAVRGVREWLKPRWINYILKTLPSAELAPFIQLFNPDWLSWNESLVWYQRDDSKANSIEHDALKVISWLRQIRPIPEDIIHRWEDYRFMAFYERLNHQIHDQLYLISQLNGRLADGAAMYPPLDAIGCIQAKMKSLILKAPRMTSSPSPLLLRIFHAGHLLDPRRSYFSSYLSLAAIRDLLDLSWEDVRASIGSLYPLFTQEPVEIGRMILDLPLLCLEIHPIVSRDLAHGFMRVFRQQSKQWLGSWSFPWGEYVRSSSHPDPELLREIREFTPPPQWILMPSDIHDVLRWLEAAPSPQIDLIKRWEGYLDEAWDKSPFKRNQYDLETRWKDNLKRKTDFYSPLPPESIEEVVRCWDHVPRTIQEAWKEYKDLESST